MLNHLVVLAHGTAEEHAQETIPFVSSKNIGDRIADIEWYLQLPLFVLAVGIVAGILWLITKKIDNTLLLVSFLMLVSSFLLYEVAPIVSATGITAGLNMTLFITLIGLGSGK